MNILTSYTLRCLRKNRVRTLVTLVGIILSVALFTAVAEGAWSGRQYLVDVTVAEKGAYHGYFEELYEGKAEALAQQPELDRVETLTDLGWAWVGSESQIYPYLRLASMSEGFSELVTVRLKEGRMPENEHELLISDRAAPSTGVEFRVGQVLRLRVGRRVTAEGGEALGDYNPYMGQEETLIDAQERVYTIVGVYDRCSQDVEADVMPGSLALTVGGAGPAYKVFFTMKDIADTIPFLESEKAAAFGANNGFNRDLLLYSGVSRYSNINDVFRGLVAILFALIFLGSVALIYNSFSISVSERTKQFGLLKSIGATNRQLRRMVLTEALLLCLIGIPAGLLLGCGGIGLTLRFLQPAFDRFIQIDGLDSVRIHLTLALPALALAAGIGLLTALVSAWIPARRATRLSPMAAIRQSRDVKVRAREVKVSKLTGWLFGFPGTLAAKNFKRSRKQYRATVISLFLSIVLFISAFSFADYLRKDIAQGVDRTPSDLLLYAERFGFSKTYFEQTRSELLTLTEQLRQLEQVEDARFGEYTQIELLVPETDLTREVLEAELDRGSGDRTLMGDLFFLPEEDYRALCAETGADPEARQAVAYANMTLALREGDTLVFRSCSLLREDGLPITASIDVVLPRADMVYVGAAYDKSGEGMPATVGYEFVPAEDVEENQANPNEDQSVDYTHVQMIPPEEAVERRELVIGGVLKSLPLSANGDQLTLYLPLSAEEELGEPVVGCSDEIYIQAPQHETAKLQVEELVQGLELGGRVTVRDTRTGKESAEALLLVLNVFTFGFIILISLIAAANVFNTISTNVALRRREFATLKSVGMGNRAFGRMMRFECLLYGAKALLWGLPVSVGISWLIWRVVDEGFGSGAFRPPWTAMAIAAGSVFLVVFATMLYATGKLKKDNPIDALKQETL